MPSRPPIARTLPTLHRAIDLLRRRHARTAIVPTMGALHEGHLSLVRLAKQRAEKVIVSIFVNPTQFAANEDFGSYPRTLNADVAKLAEVGVDLVWAPSADVMYPSDFASSIKVEGPAVAGLEDAFRPHFFGGVASVVGKLFNQCRPDFAMFGQKDYQQLMVVTRMAADLDMRVKVVGAPIVRERDGLAMSSRNVYLSTEERAAAPVLYRTLRSVAGELRQHGNAGKILAAGRRSIEAAGFAIDYLEARHAHTLAPISSPDEGPIRVLVAARIGRTRLIDNVKV